MSIRESIFSCEPKQREVDLSDLTGVPNQKGTMVELTLGDRELLERILTQNEHYHRAAYICFCLYEENEKGEATRVFSESDIPKLADLPFQKLHPLYEDALRVCSILSEDESVDPVVKN